MFKFKHSLAAAAVGAFALAAAPQALAVASQEIYVEDVNTSNGDVIGTAQVFTGSTGHLSFDVTGDFAGWTIFSGAGNDEAVYGGIQDLNVSFNSTSAAAGTTLKVFFASDSYSSPGATTSFLSQDFSLNLSGSVTGAYTSFRDVGANAATAISDVLSGGATTLSVIGVNGMTPGPFSSSAALTASTNYALIQEVSIADTGGTGSGSGDVHLQQAPDGGVTASLLGFAFLGVAALRRKGQHA